MQIPSEQRITRPAYQKLTSNEKEDFWKSELELLNESKISTRKFCSSRFYSEHTFSYWRKKLNNPKPKVGFEKVILQESPLSLPSGYRLELTTPSGIKITVTE